MQEDRRKQPKVSIIVPIYNAEKALRRCVDSILNQEFTDFEVLLINDGSKDSSGEICDQYAARDNRVRVVHKPNSGVSATRNLALDLAQGTYVQFLDADDWITPEATKLLVRTMEENDSDMVIADFYRVVGERLSRKGDIEEDRVLTRQEYAEHMMENPADFYYGVLWNKLYRRDIIEQYHVRMDEDVRWCEDFLFNMEYVLHADRICPLQVPLYYYVKTEGSLVSQINLSKIVKMKLMVFEYYNEFYKNVYEDGGYEKKRLQIYRFLIDAAGDSMVAPPLVPGVHKLGSERIPVNHKAVDTDSIFMDHYRSRKLMDRYLEVVALEHDLSMNEVRLLLYLSQPHSAANRRELADFANMSYSTVLTTLPMLAMKGLVKISDARAEDDSRKLSVQFTEEAAPILQDISVAVGDFEETQFTGFDEEDKVQYARLNQKIKENMVKILKPEV